MVFHRSLSDSMSLQVSRTLLSILANLNNAIVWMVSPCPLISKSSSPFTKPLRIVPSASIKITPTITFMFHRIFSSLTFNPFIIIFIIIINLILTLHLNRKR